MKVTMTDGKSRGMGIDAITILLNKAPVGRMAAISPDGIPYIVPVNFAFECDRIYFHCALEGMKLDYIRANPDVGFEATSFLSFIRPLASPAAAAHIT